MPRPGRGSPGHPPAAPGSLPIASAPRLPTAFPRPRKAPPGRPALGYVLGDYLAAEDLGGGHGEGGQAAEHSGAPGASAGRTDPQLPRSAPHVAPNFRRAPATPRKRCPRPGGGRRGARRGGQGFPSLQRLGSGCTALHPVFFPAALRRRPPEGKAAERRNGAETLHRLQPRAFLARRSAEEGTGRAGLAAGGGRGGRKLPAELGVLAAGAGGWQCSAAGALIGRVFMKIANQCKNNLCVLCPGVALQCH